MIINGIKINSKEEFIAAIADMDDESKAGLTLIFNEDTKIKDQEKYAKRAIAKDQIMVEMATENMERVRKGLWTTSQLVALTQDTELKLIQDDIGSLSFELAVMKLMAVTNPLITADIKMGWIKKLQSHFYNE
jgi:hypothetical protein